MSRAISIHIEGCLIPGVRYSTYPPSLAGETKSEFAIFVCVQRDPPRFTTTLPVCRSYNVSVRIHYTVMELDTHIYCTSRFYLLATHVTTKPSMYTSPTGQRSELNKTLLYYVIPYCGVVWRGVV